VVEIGAGPGGLTRALLTTDATRIVAVERDPRALAALGELAAAFPGRLEVVAGDALALDPRDLVPAPRKIVANLPYNIATALLLRWLPQATDYAGFVLMFQKEVAERLVARPRSKSYGRLSVIVQWLCETQPLFDVPPQAFVPPPKVTSTVVEIRPRAAPLAPCRLEDLERVTQAGFGQRRKMLRASLRTLTPDPERLLASVGIAPTRRAEELEIAEFCALARAIEGNGFA
jgi:16S rRNA (adenine1518-N6/adenine1519-N6)-dimethyltransferase